jgi:hypothetical protein
VNGAVTMTATDLDQTARYTFDGSTATGTGALIIPFQSLKDLTKGHDRELIEIEADTPEAATIINHVGSMAVKKTVYGTPLDEWPVIPESQATKPAEGFLETFRRLLPFASEDPTRHMLSGICVDVKGKGERPVTMVATDGRRLTSCNSMCLPLDRTTVIPSSRFLAWAGLQGETQEIGIKTEMVKEKEGKKTVERAEVKEFGLKTGPWTYSCRTIAGSYPNWRQVIPDLEYCKDNSITLTDEDVESLRKILPTFPGHEVDTPSITLGAGPEGAVQIAGRGKNDKAATTLDLTGGSRFEGKSRTCLNREFLLDALNAGFRSYMFTDGNSPIRGDDGHGGTHCLMPMRMEEPAPQAVPETKDGASTTAVGGEAPATPEPATDNQGDGAQPEPATTETEPKLRRNTMPEKTNQPETTESSTLDKAIQAVENARAKLREGVSALVDVADALKAAAKEGKAQAADLEKARTTLQKLQAISL